MESLLRGDAAVRLVLSTAVALLVAAAPLAAAPKVVASVPPVHGLASAIMDGIGLPILLVPGGRSPHDYSMRPSDARALEAADAIFWVGPSLEAFLARAIETLGDKDAAVALESARGVKRLTVRAGGVWDDGDRNQRHGHDGHAAPATDGHIWLSPANARAMAAAMAATLAVRDPANARQYSRNADRLARRIDALDAELNGRLAPVRATPFIVFHDAYQYFEAHYGLAAAGSVTVSAERSPGARRLSQLRRTVRERGVACVFREPQFAPAVAETIVEGTPARTGVLDPLGASLTPGPDSWFALMRGLASSLAGCLAAVP